MSFSRNAAAALLIAGAVSCKPTTRDDAGAGRTHGILTNPIGILGAEAPDGAVVLIDEGGGLEVWRHEKVPKEPIRWGFADGVLTIVPGEGSIVTKEMVGDFRLHLEFKINASAPQPDGNSGIYIQRRYELQILDPAAKAKPEDRCGAIYGLRAPDADATRPAGEWQVYDLVFRSARWNGGEKIESARLTVYLNGTLIHDDVPIPHKTGAGREETADPQPLKLQDHGNAVAFRNTWIMPLDLSAPSR